MAKRSTDENTGETQTMQPDNSQPAATEATTAAPATTAAAGVSVSAIDERFRTVKDPETGQLVKRADYIRKCWVDKKMSRGAIAKHLTELNSVANGGNGKKIAYQVVFAVIKRGTPGGPDQPTSATA